MIISSYIPKNAKPEVVQKRHLDIARAINGGLEFGSPSIGLKNHQGYWLDTTTPGADVEFIVNHNLGYVPTGIITFFINKAAIIYASQENLWSATQIRLKCSVATTHLKGFVA